MTDLIECHVCHSKDTLQRFKKVKFENSDAVYAHPRCVEQHNRTAAKNLRAIDASSLATMIAEYDIDATDHDAVERFLRENRPENLHLLGGRCPSVAEIAKAACEQREQNNRRWLFEMIEKEVEPWPAQPSENIIADVVGSIGEISPHLRGEGARDAALLLIEQVAWRKHAELFEAAAREYEEGSDGVACP